MFICVSNAQCLHIYGTGPTQQVCRVLAECLCIFTEKHLSKYAQWHAPRAGMFLWLKLKHIDDSMQIFEDLKEANVVVVPGQ